MSDASFRDPPESPARAFVPAEVGIALPARSRRREVWRQFRSHKGAVPGLAFLLLVTVLCAAGPWLWPLDSGEFDAGSRDVRPIYHALWDPEARVTWAHPLGSDQLGPDQLARLIAGGQVSLAVGWTAMLLALVVGTLVGVLAGCVRRLDGPLMRFTDFALVLPLLPLLLMTMLLYRDPLRAMFGPGTGTFVLVVAAIGLTSWMHTARMVRGEVLALREREFVLAATSIGTPARRVFRRHILPNLISPIMVSATPGLASAIVTESALSFLGLGFPSDIPTWGKLLADSVVRMADFPERVLGPGLAISLTVLSVSSIGDGLRDALGPRIRGR